MENINIKIEVPSEFKDKFEEALNSVVKDFARRLEFSMANEMLSGSELTKEKISKLSSELKGRVAKKHGL